MKPRHLIPTLLLLALVVESLPGVQVRYAPGPDTVIVRWLSHWNFSHMNPLAMLALASTILAIICVLLLFKSRGDSTFPYVMTILGSAAGALSEGAMLLWHTVFTGSRRIFLMIAAIVFLAGAAVLALVFRRSMRFEE